MKIKSVYYPSLAYEVTPIRTEYANNKNLAIQLMGEDGEPYAMLTVNLGQTRKRGIKMETTNGQFDGRMKVLNDTPTLPEDMAYVDINNIPNAEEFIAENGLGTNTGIKMVSGFCVYPLYRFNLDKLERR